MTWTFANDFTTQRDRIRVEIGDTVTTDQLLADEAITYAETVEGSDIAVAARCCEWIAAIYSRKADITEGKFSVRASQRAKAYETKARLLRAADGTNAQPYLGGESISDKNTTNEDADRVPPAFFRNQMDDPLAQQSSPGGVDEGDASDLDE